MSHPNLFLDSSALVAGIISSQGAARVLLLLAETGQITIMISEQVVAEAERAVARKAAHALPDLRRAIQATRAHIGRDPSPEEVKANLNLIAHPADVPILLTAKAAKLNFLVTLNRRQFLDDPQVGRQTGLRIGTPDDALNWLRGLLTADR
jgi:predicted nucleic acid-binding protein